jgi:uncharacterized membrane protein
MSKKVRKSGRRAPSDAVPAAQHGARTRATTISVRDRNRHPLDNWLLGLALAGIALTAYLTFTAWFGKHPAFCGADSGCDLVQQSRWSTLLRLPIAFWGLLTYALLAHLMWRLRTRPSIWRATLMVTVIGAAVSWYLTAVSIFAIEALCSYCLASFVIMNALLVLVLVRRPTHMPEHAWSNSLPAPFATALVMVTALFLHFSGLFDPAAGPEKPQLAALAAHLRDSGARFYGTYWCPACQKQKALFEASADKLPYIECTPNGRNGPANLACIANSVRDYPTWVIDGRRYTGVLTVTELTRISRFQWPAGTAESASSQ